MTTNWPGYGRYLGTYERDSRKMNGVLYQMCSDMPLHTDEGDVWAKAWIIGRSYASGIERHAADGLKPVVGVLRRSAPWLDQGLAALRKFDPPEPTHAGLPEIAALHGRLSHALAKCTRDGNQVRSFVAKYLHFHAPVVPIYDSSVGSQVRARGWYPWRRAWTTQHPTPAGADGEYWRHCVRIAFLAEDWRAEGLDPTARKIDTYVYSRVKEK